MQFEQIIVVGEHRTVFIHILDDDCQRRSGCDKRKENGPEQFSREKDFTVRSSDGLSPPHSRKRVETNDNFVGLHNRVD